MRQLNYTFKISFLLLGPVIPKPSGDLCLRLLFGISSQWMLKLVGSGKVDHARVCERELLNNAVRASVFISVCAKLGASRSRTKANAVSCDRSDVEAGLLWKACLTPAMGRSAGCICKTVRSEA